MTPGDNGLSDAENKALTAARNAVLKGQYPTLVNLMNLKRTLRKAVGADRAFELFSTALNLGEACVLQRQDVVDVLVAARDHATVVHEIHPGGEDAELPAPRTRGAATEARAIRGKSRKVAVACLQNATAFARSTTVRLADGTFAFDLQAGELGRMPVDPAFDPVVFDWDGAQMTVIDDRRRSNNLHVPEALSLLGPDTVSYGHWMAEEFPKFLTARQVVDLKGIPILIDADIPPQHRQSIVAFVGENHPIITVPRNLKVTADRLWVVTNWLYSPKFLTTDRDIDVDALAYPPTHFANVFSKAWDDLETLIGGVEAARARVFVSRDPKRHRNSANHTEVLALLEARGFQDVRPGELSFLEQFRLYRSASRVVVQAGSAATGLFMCRPGTRVCHLSQVTAMPLIPIWSALMAGLKVDTTILLSKVAERHAIYEDFSSYTVDVAALGNLVAEWEETPFE